jgi:hypothetical protein
MQNGGNGAVDTVAPPKRQLPAAQLKRVRREATIPVQVATSQWVAADEYRVIARADRYRSWRALP